MKKLNSFSKRILALLLSALMLLTSGILSAVAVTVDLAQTGATITSDGTARLYFNMASVSWWTAGTNGNGNFAYFFNNSTNKNAWSAHAVKYSGDTYYVVIPAGSWAGVILTRNNTSTAPSWNNKWNQTGDITLSSSSNYISKFAADSTSVTWGTAVKITSTASVTPSATKVAPGDNVTLTPALTSNANLNTIKSTTYSVNGSGASVNNGVFSATEAGTYTVTATVTYHPNGYSSLTSTATATTIITVEQSVVAPTTPAAPTVVFNNTYGGTGTQDDPYLVEAGVKTNMTVTGELGDAEGLAYNVDYTASKVDWTPGATSFEGYEGVTAPALGVTKAVNTYLWAYNGSGNSRLYSSSYATTTVYIKGVYTATFNDYNNKQIDDTVIYDGTAISAPDAPSIDGYTFTGWTDDNGTFYSKDTTLPAITKNTTYTATYSANPHTFEINYDASAGSVAIAPENDGTIHYDDKITLTATANTGYRFTGWSGKNGTETITDTNASLSIKVKGDVYVTATFEKLTEYTVTISSADTSMGNVDKTSVTGYSGDKVTITATPTSSDYVVDYWTLDGDKVNAGNSTYTFDIKGNHTVSVYWVKQGWTGYIYVEDARTTKWDSMNIYTWNSSTNKEYTGAWSGTAMTQVSTNNGNPVYAIPVSVDASIIESGNFKVILSNAGNNQTGDDDVKITTTQNYVILSDSGITYKWSNLAVDLPVTVYLDNGTTDTKNSVKIGQTTLVQSDNVKEISDLKHADDSSSLDPGGYRSASVVKGGVVTIQTTLETANSDYYLAGWVINGDSFLSAKYMGTDDDGRGYYQNSYTFTESRNTVVPIYFHTDNWLAANNKSMVKVYAVGDPSVSTWDRYMGAFTWDDDNSYAQFGNWQGQLMIPVEGLDNVYYTYVERSTSSPHIDDPDGITFSNFGYNTDCPTYPVTEYSNIQTYDYYEFLELLEQGKENITFVLKPETDSDHQSNEFSTNTSIATAYDFEVFTDTSSFKNPLDINREVATDEEVGLYIVRQFVNDSSHAVGQYRIVCHLYKPDGTYIGNCTSYELLDIPTLSEQEGFSYLASEEIQGKRVMVEYESVTSVDNGTRYDGEWYADADVEVKVNLYAYVGLTTDNGATYTTDTDDTDGLNDASYGTAYAQGGAVATVVKGKSASISAVAKAGYKFIGWYSANGTRFSTSSTYTIADVSFDTYVTAVFQQLKDDEFVINHTLYTGGATGYNPTAFGGTGDLYIGVADENGTDISPLEIRNSLSFDAVEDNTYIIKIATDPHGADKFYSWLTDAVDKFGNTTYEEVGVDNYTGGQYGNIYDNGVDTVVGSNGLVQFWFYHTVGTDFTLDLFSNISAVSADVKLVYKYEDRTGAARSVTVPYTLTDKEVDNGYVPSDEIVKANAPYVDDYYTNVTWDITKFDDVSFIIWATQADPVYIVKLNYGSSTEIFPGTYNSEMTINATELGAKSDKGYWFEDANENQTHDEGEKIVAYGRYYGLVITEDVTLCYVEDASIDFDIVLDQPVYTREQETDASGNITTDKIYIDYLTSILIPLFRFDETAGGEKITDTYYNDVVIPNANSPVTIETLTEHFGYEIEYGVILEQLQNRADFGVNRSGDDTLVDYLNGERYNSERNRYATVFNATSNPITNKNRLLITIDMKNSSNNQKKYYNVYGYLKVKDDAGETKYYFSDMRTLNIYEIGNSKGEQIVVSQ